MLHALNIEIQKNVNAKYTCKDAGLDSYNFDKDEVFVFMLLTTCTSHSLMYSRMYEGNKTQMEDPDLNTLSSFSAFT